MSSYLFYTLVIGFVLDQSIVFVFKKYLGKKRVKYSFAVRPTSLGNKKRYKTAESYTIAGVRIPKGYISDGASIPAIAWRYVGSPYAPEFINIAIAHDYCYDYAISFYKTDKKQTMKLLKQADKWFYSVMRDQNSKVISFLFYVAVRVYSSVKFGIYYNYIKKLRRKNER